MKHPSFLDLTPYSLAERYHVLELPAATFVTVCCALQDGHVPEDSMLLNAHC